MMAYEVHYFDGKTSKPYETLLYVTDDGVCLQGISKNYTLNDITLGPKLNHTPQKISFSDGAYCEFKDDVHFTLPGKTSGHFVLHLEQHLKYALIAFISMIALATLSLTVGSTHIANWVSEKIPQEMVNTLSANVLDALDQTHLKPSELDKDKKAYLTQAFQEMVKHSEYHYTLYFRSSPIMGANAFALPSGEIILLDQLVNLDDDPKLRGVLGVLAHEAGHVEHKHGLKSAAKASISAAVLGYFLGDFSGFATMLGSFALNANYSRAFEEEADAYAIKLTQENQISTKYIADLFEKLPDHYESLKLFNTHPSMKERINHFREKH